MCILHNFLTLGRSWFDRFLTLWSDFAELLNRGQIAKIENDPISIRTWIHERDNYTRLYRQPKRYATKKYIFVAEMIVLEISRKNLMQYCVVVSTNEVCKLFCTLKDIFNICDTVDFCIS